MHPQQRKIRWRNLGYLHAISVHFSPFSSEAAPLGKMIGRTTKEAGNLADRFYGGGGPEGGSLSSRPHVLMATLVEGWRR
jgi:hypothetical protein